MVSEAGDRDSTVNERPVRLSVSDDLKRGRASVFFRFLLSLPFLLWLAIWSVAAFFAGIFNWTVTLVAGRPDRHLHGFLARYVRYATHVYAFLNLAAEPFPGVGGRPGYPIDLEIDPPARQNRWSVAFRLVLAVPALLLATVLLGSTNSPGRYLSRTGSYGIGLLGAAAFLAWFFAVARGRMPRGLRDLIAYALSYGAQLWAYLLVLTDRYPSSDPLTAIGPLPTRDDPVQMDVDDDLRRSRLTVFFRLLLALPHLVWLTLWGIVALLAAIVNWVATFVAGASPSSCTASSPPTFATSSTWSPTCTWSATPFRASPGPRGATRSSCALPTVLARIAGPSSSAWCSRCRRCCSRAPTGRLCS